MKIAILIPTRNRLTFFLSLIETLCEEIGRSSNHEFSLIAVNTGVIDYKFAKPETLIPFYYFHLPSTGYVIPRNQLLSKVDDSFDLGIFIDDDEYPGVDWIQELVRPFSDPKIIAVTGPVHPDFQGYTGWMRELPLYFHHVSGHSKNPHILGGNLALNLRKIFPIMGRNLFDMRFNSFGGEDTCLSKKIVENFGANSIYLNHSAVVYEKITEDRLQQKWVIGRSRNSGRAIATLRVNSLGRIQYLYHIMTILKCFLTIATLATPFSSHSFKIRILLIRAEIVKTNAHLREILLRK